jgi:putative component of toxin-antitoxin plasmid stabilization module
MVEVLEYLDQNGRSPFADWFNGLDAQAAAKVVQLKRSSAWENWSNVKGVGGGVYERVIDFGQTTECTSEKMAIRSWFCSREEQKKRQDSDVTNAKERWQDYKQRKKSEK